ncbi:hypothetical protein REPUB_Repub16aG0057700 [Reevesia pubescens]
MSALILDLITDILLRLPVKALLRFRSLSKSFATEIDSPAFIKAHLKQSVQAKSHRNVVYSGTRHMRYKKLPVCLLKFPTASFKHASVLGFGYDYAPNDYKVVRIEQYYVDSFFRIQVWVFSLASNSWRKIQLPNCSGQYFRSLDNHGVFAGGALHWLSNSFRDGWDDIVSFDVSKEEFRKVFPPVRPHQEGFTLSLEVVGGDLVLCSNSTDFYEVEMLFGIGCVGKRFAWKKLYEHDLYQIRNLKYIDFVKPLEYSKDGKEILLHSDCGDLYWYDLKDKTIEDYLVFDSSRVSDELFFCWESLVSVGADSEFDAIGELLN